MAHGHSGGHGGHGRHFQHHGHGGFLLWPLLMLPRAATGFAFLLIWMWLLK